MLEIEPAVRIERTGWRDLELSQRHRQWGWNCPAVDLDFLFLEYDNGKATAVVEYKNERAAAVNAVHPTYQALIDLGNRAQVPVFVVRYSSDFSRWLVSPMNRHAREHMQSATAMSEAQYVAFLYRVRGRDVPSGLIEKLMSVQA